MPDDTKVVIRDGQQLGSGDLFADCEDEEVEVALVEVAVDHPLIAGFPDNEHGESVQSSRQAMHLASLAATRARERGNVDADGRVMIAVEDLEAIG